MLRRAVRVAISGSFLLALPFAGGCTTSETFVVQTSTGWTNVYDKHPVEITRRPAFNQPEESYAAPPIAIQRNLAMSGARDIRQQLVTFGAAYHLAPRVANASELADGYTEAIARDNGPAILWKESSTGRYVTIKVAGPANDETRQIIQAIREASAPVSTRHKDTPEDIRRMYNLPGKIQKQ